jgi:Na+(H+)/acetate symporter ActP
MRTTKQIITLVMGIVGILLIVRGVWGGVWPVSIQLIAGAVLLVYAILRWRFML